MVAVEDEDKNILIKFSKFPHTIGAFPPFYSKREQKFVVSKLGFQFYALPLVLILISVDNAYLWIFISPNMNLQSVETPEFMNFYIHVLSRSFACILGFLLYYQVQEFIEFCNVVFYMEQYVKGKKLILFEQIIK